MDTVEQELWPFLNNSKFVFNSCGKKWLVVLEKISKTSSPKELYTETNEEREVFDPNFAEYRGSRFKVVAIINKFDPTKKINSIGSSRDSSVIYKVGEIVKSDGFDSNPTVVNGKGISYFKTPEPAYYYELSYVKNGIFKEWYENGQLEIKCHYKDGELDGEYKKLYENGQLSECCFYKDGKRDGEYQEWYENGKLEIKCYYENSELDGEYQEWYENGQLSECCSYKDGKQYGEYRSWYKNGELKEKCHYKNGK